MKYNILIGGAAGQGIDTLSLLIEKILKRKGYFIHSHKDYMSRIRGGHNFTQIRFSTGVLYREEKDTFTDKIDYLTEGSPLVDRKWDPKDAEKYMEDFR